MGFLRKVGGAAATGTGAVLGTVFDRKTRNLFKNRFIGKKPPLNAHEVAEIAAQLKPESLDNENFRLQAQKISITKHHAEREINNAIDKVAKTVGPDLAFPKDKAEAEKLWAELGLELSTIEKSVLPFSFSIRTFMTIYQHELQNLAAEEIQTKKIAKEVGIREKEIEFLERSLGTNGVFNQLLEEIRECNQKTNLCDQIVSSHVAAEAGEKKLDGAALMPFTFSFREISKKEKAATKLVHQFFKRNKGKITNFEIQAQIAAHAARQNTKMF
ncbi:hypothetical protein KY306_02015, partial [Candidatus Woesearchaeota archaeon]|nr:hypothetical protein [Candidatus Woesearchaeota archaeon]